MALAVDTNVLVQLGAGDAATLDAFSVLQERLPQHRRWVVPTVAAELHHHSLHAVSSGLRQAARLGLKKAVADLGFEPAWMAETTREAVERAAGALLRDGLLPADERNDGRILAEAAALGCELLVSDDSHLRSLDRAAAERVLAAFALELPAIITTREIVRMFYR